MRRARKATSRPHRDGEAPGSSSTSTEAELREEASKWQQMHAAAVQQLLASSLQQAPLQDTVERLTAELRATQQENEQLDSRLQLVRASAEERAQELRRQLWEVQDRLLRHASASLASPEAEAATPPETAERAEAEQMEVAEAVRQAEARATAAEAALEEALDAAAVREVSLRSRAMELDAQLRASRDEEASLQELLEESLRERLRLLARLGEAPPPPPSDGPARCTL